jgi:hypothetical protein
MTPSVNRHDKKPAHFFRAFVPLKFELTHQMKQVLFVGLHAGIRGLFL